MFTLSTFKPSSGINQDYANSKSLIFAAIAKLRDDGESHCRRKEKVAVYFTMLASEMWSMLATSIAMATFTGGPARGEVRKESKPAPSPIQTHPHTFSAHSDSISASHSSLRHPSVSLPPNILPRLKHSNSA